MLPSTLLRKSGTGIREKKIPLVCTMGHKNRINPVQNGTCLKHESP